MTNSMDPDQTAPIVCSGSTLLTSILYSLVMLGNYLQQKRLQQTTFSDGSFRVKAPSTNASENAV